MIYWGILGAVTLQQQMRRGSYDFQPSLSPHEVTKGYHDKLIRLLQILKQKPEKDKS